MCGRYSLTSAPEAVRKLFAAEGPLANWPPRYNIAPTQAAPVVRRSPATGAREIALLRWGLVPAWSQGPSSRYAMINARADTVAEKPAFRAAFRSRRCLVPADGFYEWRTLEKGKQPYRITLESDDPFAFAGLWESWSGGGEEIQSFTIIVTEANERVAPIHDRMPVILATEHWQAWLAADPGPAETLTRWLRPYPSQALRVYPVSTRVNSPGHDDPECIRPLEAAE